jgi:cyclic pyranopterin phosphate synthase
MTEQFTHFDESGRPHMVDVTHKEDTDRVATAQAVVEMLGATRELIEGKGMKKGDVIQVAELAGIMAAKRTADLIPLCHPIPITKVTVQCAWLTNSTAELASLGIIATVHTTYRTGVEMEALTACTTAALTVYDMCKSVDRAMTIRDIKVLYKRGGKSGVFQQD